jgi:HPt (histidine-containing phosphotransfer) domain-containing protein
MFQTIKHFLKEEEKRIKDKKRPCECETGCSYLDIQQGMLRIGNNEKLYYEVLDKYLMDLKDSKTIVEETSKTEDYVSLGKVVHKLKGTSGNVGAIELYQAAKILMDAIRSGLETDIEPYYVEFVSVFNETEKIVKKCLNKHKTKIINKEYIQTKTSKRNQNDVYELLLQLDELLKKSDLDSFKLADEIDKEILNQEGWESVKELMHDYQFKQATDELQNLLDGKVI